MKKIIIIKICGSSPKELEDIQLELFKNGCKWATTGQVVETYFHSVLMVVIDNNDNISDCMFYGCTITYTLAEPLP